MRDIHNHLHSPGAAVAANADNTAVVSPIVDVRGYGACEFFIGIGTLADADATFTVLVEEGADPALADAAAVADADLLGTEAEASFTFADDNAVKKIGYIGAKRYARCTVNPANNASAAPIAIIPVLGYPSLVPTPTL